MSKMLISFPLQGILKHLLSLPNAVMIATKEEMDAANLEAHERDFCAHYLIEWQRCRDRERPFMYRCHHDQHNYKHCQFDE